MTGTAGARRHYSPILAAHRCKGIVAHWIDEREVELDADGVVITPPMAGYYRIRPFLGQPGQTADPALRAAFPEITPAHDFAGLTGAHIWAQRPPEAAFSTIYPRGRQGDYAPVLDGHDHIHDPRTGTRSWTRNAALILAFWITEILGQEVDWAEVATEADVADAPVVNAAGSLQPRWTLDGTIRDDQEFEESRAQLAAACDAFLYERADGKVGFRLGRWEEPAVTLTDADFLSLEVSFGEGGRQAPSEIAVRYTEPALGWREALAAAHVIDPAARLKRDEPALPHITSHVGASMP